MTIVRKQSKPNHSLHDEEKSHAINIFHYAKIENRKIPLTIFIVGFAIGSLFGLLTFLILSQDILDLHNKSIKDTIIKSIDEQAETIQRNSISNNILTQIQSLTHSEIIPEIDLGFSHKKEFFIDELDANKNTVIENEERSIIKELKEIPTTTKEENIDSTSRRSGEEKTAKKSKYARIQNPIKFVQSSDTPKLPDLKIIENFWTTKSFYSDNLPSPLPLLFSSPTKTNPTHVQHAGVAIKSKNKNTYTVLDQLHKEKPNHFALRFSILRALGTVTWKSNSPELVVPLVPVTITESPSPSVGLNLQDLQSIKIKSFADLPERNIGLKLSKIAPNYNDASNWKIQEKSENFNFIINITTAEMFNKLMPYISGDQKFEISNQINMQNNEGFIFLKDGQKIASLYATMPNLKYIQQIGKDLGSSTAFYGKESDLLNLPFGIKDRLLMIDNVLSQIETIWLITPKGLIPLTKEELFTNGAFVYGAVKSADGFLQKRVPIIEIKP